MIEDRCGQPWLAVKSGSRAIDNTTSSMHTCSVSTTMKLCFTLFPTPSKLTITPWRAKFLCGCLHVHSHRPRAQTHLLGTAAPSRLHYHQRRTFSSTPSPQSWLFPKRGHTSKSRKGRPRVPTGGSTRGTTIVWGDYGIRMKDHDRRVSASQLSIGAETIKRRLRGLKYKLYTRICANIGVYTSGNEVRMGKGKGSFDYWASRVAVSKIIFEVKGELHEQVVRDAFRLAAAKMPGVYA